LVRTIYEEPIYKKPEIGEVPEWLTNEIPDALYPLKEATSKRCLYSVASSRIIDNRSFIDAYTDAMKHFYVESIDEEMYLDKFKEMKKYRDVFLDHLKNVSESDGFGDIVGDEIEEIYNSLYNIETYKKHANSCNQSDSDLFLLHIWEFFVCTITYMLHFEKYMDINKLLSRTYFLRISPLSSEKKPFSYEKIQSYSKMMEERIKRKSVNDLARKLTLTGHYIVLEREYLPIYSAKNGTS